MEKKLPKNWVETELAKILKLKNGYAFKTKDYREEGIPLIRIGNIQQENVSTVKSIYVDKNDAAEDFIVEKGDVLVAMSGATTGKYGVFKEDIKAYQNQRVGNLKPLVPSLTSRQFLYYLLGGLQKEIEDKAYGGAQPNISPKLIETIKIGLPPLAEQQRIVAKLDELFGHLDNLKTRLNHIPQILKNFRQAVLTQAVTGKLTEEWRDGKELEEWQNSKINDIISSIDAGKSFKCPEYPVKKGTVGLVKISAVTRGVFKEQETKTVTNPSKINEKYFINSGDFLITRANTLEYVGASVIVDKIEFKIMLSDKVWRINFLTEGIKYYASLYLKSSIGRKEIESRATGNQISMRNLSQNNFRDINIVLPSTKEQTEIVKRVENLFTKADAIEAQYQSLKTKIDRLPQAILAKAFKGELVAQLDTDGDAKELLEEIERLKVEVEGKSKTGK